MLSVSSLQFTARSHPREAEATGEELESYSGLQSWIKWLTLLLFMSFLSNFRCFCLPLKKRRRWVVSFILLNTLSVLIAPFYILFLMRWWDKVKSFKQERVSWGAAERQKTSFPTCTKSIITGVHFSEVGVDGGALSRIIGAVQTAVADCVKITAVWGEITEGGD